MDAYVICCNDSVEFVVIDDEARAEAKLQELRVAYDLKNPPQHKYSAPRYWHIHTVDCE